MPSYRRNRLPGGSYFFTLVTHARRRWLCEPEARAAFRAAIEEVRRARPFRIDAWVLLPDHLHCLWTLPPGDADYSTRWRLVKTKVSIRLARPSLWQDRFWEHTLRDARDLEAHAAYIHYNPVKHGLCARPADWPYSTLGRFVAAGLYPPDWATEPAASVGHE
jgi:putative transposase